MSRDLSVRERETLNRTNCIGEDSFIFSNSNIRFVRVLGVGVCRVCACVVYKYMLFSVHKDVKHFLLLH